MTDMELYILLLEAFLLGIGLGAVTISYYKWAFVVWDYFYRRYDKLRLKVNMLELPGLIDSAFMIGSLLILSSIWLEDMKYFYTGLWMIGMALFAYQARRE